MWLISVRDLRYRMRRFLIAVAVTALVFSIALVFDGVKRAMQNEAPRLVASFHADGWIVARGTGGPFTTSQVLPPELWRRIVDTAGGRADPVVLSRGVVTSGTDVTDVNVIGIPRRGLGTPEVEEGRPVERRGEVVIGPTIDAAVDDQVRVGGLQLRVVGTAPRARYFFGTPVVYVSIADARANAFGGRPLATTVVIDGRLPPLPDTVEVLTSDEVAADLRRPIKNGIETIDFTSLLLWLIAAGIIGAIVYLSALERLRDFAVFKATGVPNRIIVGGLVLQAVFLALVAALLSVGIARLLGLGFPFPIEHGVHGVIQLLLIAVVVGLVASIAGLRRAVATDPALAFGGG